MSRAAMIGRTTAITARPPLTGRGGGRGNPKRLSKPGSGIVKRTRTMLFTRRLAKLA
jgi:hypothetical protein